MNLQEANKFLASKYRKPTQKTSAQIASYIPPRIRTHCFFSAQVADDAVLKPIKEITQQFTAGRISQGEARHKILQMIGGTGNPNLAALAKPGRVNLILTQNKRMAVAVGKYTRDRDPDVEERWPSWTYHCGRNARPEHKKFDGMTFAKNDPIWHKIYPPWDFNCNCWVENSEAKIKEMAPQGMAPGIGSGFEFDPADAFDDFKLDKFDFDNLPQHVRDQYAQRVKIADIPADERARLYDGADPASVASAQKWWQALQPQEKQLIWDYTASDVDKLSKKTRGRTAENPTPFDDMTVKASVQMDKLSSVLDAAPKYQKETYRGMKFTSRKKYNEFIDKLQNSIFAMQGYTSTSVSEHAARAYFDDPNAPNQILLTIYGKSGVYLGENSWIAKDAEVLFDKKIRFRALNPGEPGYIKPGKDANGVFRMAIIEV